VNAELAAMKGTLGSTKITRAEKGVHKKISHARSRKRIRLHKKERLAVVRKN